MGRAAGATEGGKAVSKYIDVDVFINSFREALPGLKAQVDPDLTPKAYAYLRGGEAIIEDLTKFPAADVVEVVRCRECKYWGDEAGELQRSDGVLFARCKVHNYLLDGRHTGWCPTENDFCSYGERKEGAD